MEVRRVDEPDAFLDTAGPLLLEDEARHNLVLGLAATLRDNPSLYAEHRMWVVLDAGEPVGAALRTPPFNLIVAQPRDDAALDALSDAIDEDLPGVVGARPEVESFAAAWSAKAGVTPRIRLTQGIYALERVRPVRGVSGAMRPATADDRALLLDWWRAFVAEALPHEEADDARNAASIDHRLTTDEAGLLLWEDGGAVSFAGFGPSTPTGTRVGPVYTPPELRGRGYASALVAALSEQMVERGRRFCFLYTDLANPTANAIYVRIGYEQVAESAEIVFERPA
jgi:predicted GNAT family acetyltransferase